MSRTSPSLKTDVREMIWRTMDVRGVARFPGTKGRIPNFVGAERLGRAVRLEAVPSIDLIVCGSVAVNGRGARVGKGGGFSDLEYGLLAEAGKVTLKTPIVTTVHAIQMLPQVLEMLPHDIPVDVIALPDGLTELTPAFARPRGIYRASLTPEKIAEVPVLQRLLGREECARVTSGEETVEGPGTQG